VSDILYTTWHPYDWHCRSGSYCINMYTFLKHSSFFIQSDILQIWVRLFETFTCHPSLKNSYNVYCKETSSDFTTWIMSNDKVHMKIISGSEIRKSAIKMPTSFVLQSKVYCHRRDMRLCGRKIRKNNKTYKFHVSFNCSINCEGVKLRKCFIAVGRDVNLGLWFFKF